MSLRKRKTYNKLQQGLLNLNVSFNGNGMNEISEEPIKVQLSRQQKKVYNFANQRSAIRNENENETIKSLNKFRKMYFNPQSSFLIGWQFINLVLIYVYFIQIPITIAFEEHRSEEQTEFFFQVINIPAISIFIISILMKFKTAVYKQGVLITKQNQIIIHYLKNSFFFDTLAVGSICVYQFAEITKSPSQLISYRFIVVLFYLKIYEIFSIEKNIVHSFDLNRRIKAFLKMLLLLMKIYLICNFAACGFFFLSDKLCAPGAQIVCQGCCWIMRFPKQQFPLKQQVFAKQYVFSLYWASTTMISIGYGDITPVNQWQVLYTILMQFGSGLIFAYYLNEIWSIIKEYNSKKQKISARMNTINLYMRDKKVSVQLKSRINAYLSHYYHTKNLREKQLQKEIITDLTPSLKKLLYYETFGYTFKNHQFFNGFDSELLLEVSSKIQQVGYFQNEILFKPEQEQPTCSLHYIQKGQFSNYIISGHLHQQFTKYRQDSVVGIYSFVTQMNHLSYAKATRYSLSYNLNYADWITQLRQFNQEFQNFQMIKQMALLYSILTKMKISCFFCQSVSHITQLCAVNKIRSNPWQAIQKYKTSLVPRKSFHRFRHAIKKVFARNSIITSPNSAKHKKVELCLEKISMEQFKLQNNLGYSNSQQIDENAQHIYTDSRVPMNMQYLTGVHRKASLDESQFPNFKKNKHQINSQMIREYQINLNEQVNSDNASSIIRNSQIEIEKVTNYQIYYPRYNASNQVISNLSKRLRITKSFKY